MQNLAQLLHDLKLPDKMKEAENTIMKLHQCGREFLEASFAVATSPAIDCTLYARVAASAEFKNAVTRQMKTMDPQLFMQVLSVLIPATKSVTVLGNKGMLNNLVCAFESLFEQFKYTTGRYTQEPLQVLQAIYEQIKDVFVENDMIKCELCLQLFEVFARQLNYEMYANCKDHCCADFYQCVLKQIINHVLSQGSMESFENNKFIQRLTKALKALFEPRPVNTLYSDPAFYDLPAAVTLLFQKLHSCQSVQLQDAKDDLSYLMLRFVQKVRRSTMRNDVDQSMTQFLQRWETLQLEVAQAVLEDIKQAQDFDLFMDHDSINSVFYLAVELIEKAAGGHWYHPAAAEYIMQQAEGIVNAVFGMVENAGNVRIDRFQCDDLLVIDCLKPSIDLVRQICQSAPEIEQGLTHQAFRSLEQFLDGNVPAEMWENKQYHAQIFVGVLLIRRALPNIPLEIKQRASLRGLEYSTQLHEIVFEEIAKLIISVTYDDYDNLCSFQYIGGSSLAQGLEACAGDAVPYIVDLMVQLYVQSNDIKTFQRRMLSGILSRNVRQRMIPDDHVVQLLGRSLQVMLQSENCVQSGGMVTLTKVCLGYFDTVPEKLSQYLCGILGEKEFQDLPRLQAECGQKVNLQVDNAFNILLLILDQLREVSSGFECAVVDLCTRILQVNFDVAAQVFPVLNQLTKKEVQQYKNTDPLELFMCCLQGFSTIFSDIQTSDPQLLQAFECLGYAMPYTKFVIPRHFAVILQQAGDFKTPLTDLIQVLAHRKQLVSAAFAALLSTWILETVCKQGGQDALQATVHYLESVFSALFSRSLLELKLEAEPETKRMALFCLSQFYFTYTGCREALNFPELPAGPALVPMAFVAAWSVQDHLYNLGSTWRYNLAVYVCCSLRFLQRNLQNQPLLLATLLWMHYMIAAGRYDILAEQPPQMTFGLLQDKITTQQEFQELQEIFSGLLSSAIEHAQAQENMLCPFWARTEATAFGESLREDSGDQYSRFGVEIFPGGEFLRRVRQAVQALSGGQFAPEWAQAAAALLSEPQGAEPMDIPYAL